MRKLIAAAAIGFIGLPFAAALSAPSPADQSFAATAAQSGLAEVQMGFMAHQKGASKKVRQFGETLVQDHGKANHKLIAIANAEHITLPAHPNATEQEQGGKLRVLSGAAFDQAFIQDQITDHKLAIAEFAAEAKSGRSPVLKAFAGKNLPVLKKHLQIAESLERPRSAAAQPVRPAAHPLPAVNRPKRRSNPR